MISEKIEVRMRKRSRRSKPRSVDEESACLTGENHRRKRRMARGRTTTVAMVREKLTAERKTPLSLLSQPKINCCAVRRGLDIRGKVTRSYQKRNGPQSITP